MILGRGTAKTDETIIAEYNQFLHDFSQRSSTIDRSFQNAARAMQKRIDKPIAEWTDDDILGLYEGRSKSTWYYYTAFVSFLIFRGYYYPTLSFLTTLPANLTRYHKQALLPHRQMLEEARDQLHYSTSGSMSELTLLIWLLAVAKKPLNELTRAAFEAFRDQYQTWYCKTSRRLENAIDYRMHRLDQYLVHLGIIPPLKVVLRHEEYFAQLCHQPIRQAILAYLRWCKAKYKARSVDGRRIGVLRFFLWFQEHYPARSGLDGVTRQIALEYASHLRNLTENGTYSLKYVKDLYADIRLCFEFAIDEDLDTAPPRNPFTGHDLPRNPDPVPRYLSDHDLRIVLQYCETSATLKERTVVTVLLHTGIRAAELAALQVHDVVEIQGKWKLHIREGKGLKDRVVPLTPYCLAALQDWMEHGWEQINDNLFTYHGRRWTDGKRVCAIIREMGRKLTIRGLTPHRFRHTFAVALLNYGIRESALQKLLGHKTLNMTLEYGRILDRTVEQAFNQAIEQMEIGPLSWVPNFFKIEDYTLFTEGDALNWIRLPHGYCRRHHKLHCESDVKCLLCDRFCALPTDLPRLQEMRLRFLQLGMEDKAHVVDSRIQLLESGTDLPLLETAGAQYSQLFDQTRFSDEAVLTVPNPQRKEG